MAGSWTRRRALSGAATLAVAGGWPATAGAQQAGQPLRLKDLLNRQMPQQLRALLPGEVLDAAEVIDGIAALEADARLLRLPRSPLSLAEGLVGADPEQLYALALPRLVALVDRGEGRNSAFADRAGALLARLHATQRSVPLGLVEDGQFGGDAPAIALPDTLPDIVLPAPEVEAPTVTISRSLRFDDLADEYAGHFAAAELRPLNQVTADWHLAMARRYRSRYEAAGRRADVPWYFIAVIHGLEASFNFRAHLHNGDFPLSQRTRQVPAGRPTVWLPPSDWESSAVDALRLMRFAGAGGWTLPRTLYRLEAYNGFGYRRIGRASPYLWSFTSLYDRGKFVADGRYDPRARSQQCGAAALLKLLGLAGEVALA